MSVKLRLRRIGKKGAPHYRIVVSDSRSPRDGRFIEEVGIYNPHKTDGKVVVDKERVDYWMQCGGQPTPTVKNLLKATGVLS